MSDKSKERSPERKRRHGRSRSRSRERSRRHGRRSRDRSPRHSDRKRQKRRSRSVERKESSKKVEAPAVKETKKASVKVQVSEAQSVKDSSATRTIADIFNVSDSPVPSAAVSKPVTIPIKLTELTRSVKEASDTNNKSVVFEKELPNTSSVKEPDVSLTSKLPTAALARPTVKVDVGSMKMDIMKALAQAKSSIAGLKKAIPPAKAVNAVEVTPKEEVLATQGAVNSGININDEEIEEEDCFDLSELRKAAKSNKDSDTTNPGEQVSASVSEELEMANTKEIPAPSPPKATEDLDDFDMFAADDEDFENRLPDAIPRPVVQNNHGNCDDNEGYYRATIGEVLDNQYRVIGVAGKGVFSTVLLCKTQLNGEEKTVAVKLIRANDTMRDAAQNEIKLLQELQVGHKSKYVVKLLSSFEHRNHVAMVFEPMQMNVREAMKKFGGRDGLSLRGVKVFCKQLMFALDHLLKHRVVHADIKPDNMLLDEKQSMVKLCDLGSAFKLSGVEVHDPTPYLVSRFYRAPEIILGLPYDHPVDMWSIGCCVYEMYTGKVMFPGQTNNDMLKLFMEVKGRFPSKLLRRHRSVYVEKFMMEPHFDEELRFISREIDRVSAKPMLRVINNMNPTKDLGAALMLSRAQNDDKKQVMEFKDLLDKIFTLDPSKRITVKEALKHQFLQSS
ncbi:hypothetical protein THRCLA_08669 [Thraustotheca clavata]|uniref:non-specific serine/threonine protein kinase n=1 Tax=Thraustotheca clavata TaxID=74557 RepID=A0A1V9Z3V5_9STRA|nr:hypothetical protein THRCLA_08669 [Thraustotheca clavata]